MQCVVERSSLLASTKRWNVAVAQRAICRRIMVHLVGVADGADVASPFGDPLGAILVAHGAAVMGDRDVLLLDAASVAGET